MKTFLLVSIFSCASLLTFAQTNREEQFDKNHTIDYLVVYDTSKPEFVENQGGREAYAQKIVNSINLVLKNSNLDYRFRLAGTFFWDNFKASNIEAGHDALSNSELIQQKRREAKADIVVLLTETDGDINSGLADHNDEAIHSDAYSCVNLSMAASAYTAAHEAAHILGAYHSRSEWDQAPSTHPWAAAYISPKGYRTVMNTMAPGITVPIYSGPESIWEGETMGDATHDNVRMLRHNLPRAVHFGDHLEMDQYYANEEELLFNKQGQVGEVSVYGNQFMMISSPNDWISQISPSWGNVQADVKFHLSPNTTGRTRTGTLIVSGDAPSTKIITITQTAADINIDCDKGSYQASEDNFVEKALFLRNFNDTEWQSLYLPFIWKFEDWHPHFDIARVDSIKTLQGSSDKLLEYVPVTQGNLEPHTFYLIRAKKQGKISLPMQYVNFFASTQREQHWDIQSCTYTLRGNYEQIAGQKVFNQGYYLLQNGAVTQSSDIENVLPAFRWYLSITDKEGKQITQPQIIHLVEKGKNITGIESIQSHQHQYDVYDLKGHLLHKGMSRPKRLAPGVYIINGQKVIIPQH